MTVEDPSVEETKSSTAWPLFGALVRLILIAAILAGGGYIAYHWMTNKPVAQRRPPQKQATLVEVMPVQSRPRQVVVTAMGTVVPARRTQIASRVSGQIIDVAPSFEPGGRFEQGEHIVEIERRDYELAAEQIRSALTQAQAELELEMGQQSVARREYELLGEDVANADEALLLRKPQLEMTKAEIARAKAALEKAQVDLDRTKITAPFNAVVQERNVDLGSYVTPGTNLATLIGTDEYWVEVSVPIDELKWVDLGNGEEAEGSPARIFHEPAWGPDVYRKGRVRRLMTELEPQGRMARLLLTVEDPLALREEPGTGYPLVLNSFVTAEIEGREVPQAIEIPRTALREGDRVWVMTGEHTLEIRGVDVVWGTDDFVFVTEGLEDGALLVVSDLAAPVEGMPLRTEDMTPAEPEEPREPGGPQGEGNE